MNINNPFEKPRIAPFSTPAKPLMIMREQNTIDVEQNFFKTTTKQIDKDFQYLLADIQNNEAELSRRQQEKQMREIELTAEVNDIQRKALLEMRDNELVQQYEAFLKRVNAIPFIKADQKAVLEEEFVKDLVKSSLLDTANKTVDSKTGLVVENSLDTTLAEALPVDNKNVPQMTPIAIPAETPPPSAAAAAGSARAAPPSSNVASRTKKRVRVKTQKLRVVNAPDSGMRPTSRGRGRPRQDADP